MNKAWIKTHRVLIVIVFIAVTHFILSSIIGHYVSTQMGSQMGYVVADGLLETFENPSNSDEAANIIYQGMLKNTEEIYAEWKPFVFMLSLPSGPLTDSFWKQVYEDWIYAPILSKEISRDQFKIRGTIIHYIGIGINSITFGLLVFIIVRLFQYFKLRLRPNKPLQRTEK